MKLQFKHVFFLVVLIALLTVAARPAPPQPNVQIEVLSELPATMNVGESYTVEVLVTSDIPFINAIAMPAEFYPGRYVVSPGGELAQSDTTAHLFVTFTAKRSTAVLPDGVAPVSVSVGVRYPGGVVFTERFEYWVAVP